MTIIGGRFLRGIRIAAVVVFACVFLAACGGGLGSGGSHSIHVAWQPHPDPSVTGYVIYYGPNIAEANTVASNQPIDSLGFNPQAPSVSFEPVANLGLQPGDTVCFRLKAYNPDGESGFSSGSCTKV